MKRTPLLIAIFSVTLLVLSASAYATIGTTSLTTGNTGLDDAISSGIATPGITEPFVAFVWDSDSGDGFRWRTNLATYSTLGVTTSDSEATVIAAFTSWWNTSNLSSVTPDQLTSVYSTETGAETGDQHMLAIAPTSGNAIDWDTANIFSTPSPVAVWSAPQADTSSGPNFPNIPVASYGASLLQNVWTYLVSVLPYAGALMSLVLSVLMVRRWLGRRKATQI